jgi:hypothetical protein
MASTSASSNRKLNTLETRLHQGTLLAGRVSVFLCSDLSFCANFSGVKPLSQKEIDALAPDPHARTNAINFLLAAVCGVFISDVFGLSVLL